MPRAIKYQIRDAEKEDASVILDLVKNLARYEKLTKEVTATTELFKKNGFGKTSYYKSLLVDRGDSVKPRYLGFALYFFTFSTFRGKPTLYLEDLFVLPEFRGLGIGKRLLASLAKIALLKECARMEWSVLDWNEPAIRFYESINAKPMNEWTVFRLEEKDIFQLVES